MQNKNNVQQSVMLKKSRIEMNALFTYYEINKHLRTQLHYKQ